MYIWPFRLLFHHAGFLQPLDTDDTNMFTDIKSFQENVQKYKINITQSKDLIQEAMHHHDFDPSQDDHSMH